MSGVFQVLGPTKGLFPVQLSILVLTRLQVPAVELRPSQAGGAVRDRAVAVVSVRRLIALVLGNFCMFPWAESFPWDACLTVLENRLD